MKVILKTSLFLLSLALVTSTVEAQEMIHAVSGTVTSIDAKAGTFQLKTDDGSPGSFNWVKNLTKPIDFDRNVKAETVPPGQLSATGAHVIVFYFGDGGTRTAVAVHNLGTGTVQEINGTVVKCDRHNRNLVVKDASGKEQTIHLDPKTVGDTMMGVMDDLKFAYDKGQSVVVTATQANGSATAALIEPAA